MYAVYFVNFGYIKYASTMAEAKEMSKGFEVTIRAVHLEVV